MRSTVGLLLLVTVTTLTLGGVSLATNMPAVTWSATLSAANEIPKQVVKDTVAHGTFTGTLTGTKLKFTLSFADLTGSPTMAHIHLGAIGTSGKILVWLCSPCKSPVHGTVTITAAEVKDLSKNLLYVNVHTVKNPNGEIRGQLNASMVGSAVTAP